MVINYELKNDDIWNFNKYVVHNVSSHRRIFLTNMIFIPLIVMVVGLFLKFSIYSLSAAIIVATVLYYFLAMALMKRKVVKHNSKNKSLLGDHEMVLSNSGVRVKNSKGDNMTSWKEIQSIVDSKQYIYFFITDQFSYIIPKKTFSSESEAGEFLQTAKSLAAKHLRKK
jgi:ABC-type multidrug transport system fused ATPase/permease subunit